MSTSVNSTHGNYYSNAVYDAKKNGKAEKVTTEKIQSSEEKVQEYYEKLCKKFPGISFNTKGGELPCGSNKVVVNLSYDCLKKMANDPEFAKEIEWNLSGEAAANSMVYSWAKRDGVELGGRIVTYDANGNRSSSCGGMRTANVRNSSTQKTQNQSQSLAERIIEKRAEKEKMEARLEEKRQEKTEFKEQLEEKRQERAEFKERMAEIRQERKAYLERAVKNNTRKNDPWIDALNEYEEAKQNIMRILPNTDFSGITEGLNITV